MKHYEIIVIGAGPAGLSAALYAARARRKVLVLERAWSGGQIFQTHNMRNYPGIAAISGPDFSQQLEDQAKSFGAEIQNADVRSLNLDAEPKQVLLASKEILTADSIILAMGAQARLLGVPGENEFTGRGVSYCATCDGRFFRDKRVAVIGGSDAALEEALFLTRFASQVVLLHRDAELRCTKTLQERAREEGILVRGNARVLRIEGAQGVEKLRLLDVVTGAEEELQVSGVFICVGFLPNIDLVREQIELDEQDYIVADPQTMQTAFNGVYVAGDIRRKPLRQVVTAAADGAIAAVMADRWLDSLEK